MYKRQAYDQQHGLGAEHALAAATMLLIVSFPTGLVSLLIFVGIVWACLLYTSRCV